MRAMFEDTDGYKVVCDVISVENGLDYVSLDIGKNVEVVNAVRFCLPDAENNEVYLIVNRKTGDEIVERAFASGNIDLTRYVGKVVFYPGISDVSFIKKLSKEIEE